MSIERKVFLFHFTESSFSNWTTNEWRKEGSKYRLKNRLDPIWPKQISAETCLTSNYLLTFPFNSIDAKAALPWPVNIDQDNIGPFSHNVKWEMHLWSACSVTRCWIKKVAQMFSKVALIFTAFLHELIFYKISQKSTIFSGYFWGWICCQELSKIAHSEFVCTAPGVQIAIIPSVTRLGEISPLW